LLKDCAEPEATNDAENNPPTPVDDAMEAGGLFSLLTKKTAQLVAQQVLAAIDTEVTHAEWVIASKLRLSEADSDGDSLAAPEESTEDEAEGTKKEQENEADRWSRALCERLNVSCTALAKISRSCAVGATIETILKVNIRVYHMLGLIAKAVPFPFFLRANNINNNNNNKIF